MKTGTRTPWTWMHQTSRQSHKTQTQNHFLFLFSFVYLSYHIIIHIYVCYKILSHTIPYYKYNSTLFAFSLFSSLLSLLLRNLRTEHNRALQLSLSLMASQASLLLQKQLKGAPYPAPSLTRSTPFLSFRLSVDFPHPFD